MPKKFASVEERREYYRQASRRWYARNPGRHIARYRRDRAGYIRRSAVQQMKDREKTNARVALRHAVNRGRIERPSRCKRCRKIKKITAHHHRGYDLAHRFDVVWLCHGCHGLEHRKTP